MNTDKPNDCEGSRGSLEGTQMIDYVWYYLGSSQRPAHANIVDLFLFLQWLFIAWFIKKNDPLASMFSLVMAGVRLGLIKP